MGGVEKFVMLLNERLIEKRIAVEVYATDPNLESQTIERTINRTNVTFFKSIAPKESLYFSPSLFAALKKVDVDIVHAHGYRALPMLESAFAKKYNGAKLVVTTHIGFSKLGRWLYDFYSPIFGKEIFNKADRVLVVSPTELYEVPHFMSFLNKIQYVPIGIPLNFESTKKSNDKLCLLYVGRIEKQKGLDFLLRLFKLLDENKYELTIAGDGPYRDQLINGIRESKQGNIKYVGRVPEDMLNELYTSSDVFLLLSQHEGHSVSLTESMAHGIVPIATDVGGNKFIVKDAGFLVPYPVNIKHIAELLENLCNNRQLLNFLSFKAKEQIAAQFGIDRVSDMHIKIYKQVLKE
ncbi:MAG: glycosyltransferase family 4 protein [Candidatus Bathyarchaeia archaeon]|jgi:glycosyltransferase involved in cell wall biosynthesis